MYCLPQFISILNNDGVHMLHRNNKKSMLLVSLGFASGTNNVLLSLSNRDNTLGMLVSLGFASGTRQCLGYYLLISLHPVNILYRIFLSNTHFNILINDVYSNIDRFIEYVHSICLDVVIIYLFE